MKVIVYQCHDEVIVLPEDPKSDGEEGTEIGYYDFFGEGIGRFSGNFDRIICELPLQIEVNAQVVLTPQRLIDQKAATHGLNPYD